MEKFVVKGGRCLHGEVEISGAKNAAVGIIPAVILSDEPCILENVPDISDVSISLRILYEMGAQVQTISRNTFRIDASRINNFCVLMKVQRTDESFLLFSRSVAGKIQ